jgi:hypothetical protein
VCFIFLLLSFVFVFYFPLFWLSCLCKDDLVGGLVQGMEE